MGDRILVKRLKVPTYIGVPDEERAAMQVLRVSLEMEPSRGFSGLDDEIGNSVNYYEVSERVKEVGMERPRKLIETFGEDVCGMVLTEFDVVEVVLEIEKFILPDADWVGLRMVREK